MKTDRGQKFQEQTDILGSCIHNPIGNERKLDHYRIVVTQQKLLDVRVMNFTTTMRQYFYVFSKHTIVHVNKNIN